MQENHLTLLLIEDQKFCTDLFRAAFDQHTILTAHTGQEGLQAYRERRPDIVFLDLGLPDISGFQVLEQLLALDANAYVIMLTGISNDAYISKCKQLGARGFLTKPYQKDSIEYYIGRYREAKTKR